MKRLIYLSDAAQNISEEELEYLNKQSDLNNKIKDISGFLYFNGQRFIQYLEGPSAGVEQLIEKYRVGGGYPVLSHHPAYGPVPRRLIKS